MFITDYVNLAGYYAKCISPMKIDTNTSSTSESFNSMKLPNEDNSSAGYTIMSMFLAVLVISGIFVISPMIVSGLNSSGLLSDVSMGEKNILKSGKAAADFLKSYLEDTKVGGTYTLYAMWLIMIGSTIWPMIELSSLSSEICSAKKHKKTLSTTELSYGVLPFIS